MPQFSRAEGLLAEGSGLQPHVGLSDRDFHSFAGKHRIGEPFSTQFFDALKKLVVVIGVVMREGQASHAGHFRK
jgi:hypothetical protein